MQASATNINDGLVALLVRSEGHKHDETKRFEHKTCKQASALTSGEVANNRCSLARVSKRHSADHAPNVGQALQAKG